LELLPVNTSEICFGCMEIKGSQKTCANCGYQEDSGPESSHHLSPGTILANKYLVGKVLGQGGFGITYVAYDLILELKLAVKEFFPMGLVARARGSSEVDTYAGEQKEQYAFGLDRFLYEAKTLARFSEHPNIVTVRDFFPANGTAYMVMNYIEGKTLEEYLKSAGGKIPFPKMIEIMMPVMDALREVHQAGIMHRDISPDNIFIRNDGRVSLIDFGSARQELLNKSRSISVILKVGYSPEEQYRSKGEQGPWTDIYSVAATIYRGITGEVPPESMDRLAEDTLIAPSQLGIEIGIEQEQALLKAFAVRAKERYQTVLDLQTAFLKNPNEDIVVKPTDDKIIVTPDALIKLPNVSEAKEPAKPKTVRDYFSKKLLNENNKFERKSLNPRAKKFTLIAAVALILLLLAVVRLIITFRYMR
jgi:serine/threonine protein kinase